MEITYLGLSSFKIKTKKATVIIDPFDPKMVGLPYPAQKAEIVVVSHDHGDHNNVAAVKDYKKVITGPGEYEIEGVSLIGVASYHDKKKGEERGKNTIFVIESERIRLAHLGDLGHELSDSDVNKMGDIDILMIPVGGKYTIDAAEAVKMVSKIDPKIILPMHYKTEGMNEQVFGEVEGVDNFINASGLKVEKSNKLNIAQTNLPEDEQMIVLLSNG